MGTRGNGKGHRERNLLLPTVYSSLLIPIYIYRTESLRERKSEEEENVIFPYIFSSIGLHILAAVCLDFGRGRERGYVAWSIHETCQSEGGRGGGGKQARTRSAAAQPPSQGLGVKREKKREAAEVASYSYSF